jgi:putative sigma-54 modulation protein
MQIQLTGHHVDITATLREYVNSKFERIVRHYDHVTDVHVVLTVEKLVKKAEATIHVSRANVFADAQSDDMYAAIDALIDKLDRQIKKFKEKQSDHRGNGVPQ